MKRLPALLVICILLLSDLGEGTPTSAPQLEPAAQSAPATSEALLQFTSDGQILGFQPGGIYIASTAHALHVTFIGANRVQPAASAAPTLPTQAGAGAPGQQGIPPVRSAPALGAVTWTNLWDGISLTATATQGSIFETTYTLAPGAQISNIHLGYNVPAQRGPDGSLSVPVADGALSESAPLAWQEVGGVRKSVPVAFEVSADAGGARVGFALGAYNPGLALTIDPRLEWAHPITYGHANNADYGTSLVVDLSGNLFVAGTSAQPWNIGGVATKRPFTQPTSGYGIDVYVVKLNSNGSAQWLTFLGGSDDDSVGGLALDGLGNIYVSGSSYATWGTPVQPFNFAEDAFVARLASDGSLSKNTFEGSSTNDYGMSLAFANGSLFLGGSSQGSWGDPVRAFTPNPNGYDMDAYIAQLNPSTLTVNWNTFLGGTGNDFLRKLAVDSSGFVSAVGDSDITWGSPKRGLNFTADAFVAHLDSTGHLLWNTFLGGASSDGGMDIAVDPTSGSLYVTGFSNQAWSFATMPNPVNAYTGSNDIFVAALSSSGDPIWYTFLGSSSGWDDGFGVSVSNGLVFVTGYGNGSWGSPLRAFSGGYDTFVAALNQSTGVLQWNTFYGGPSFDEGNHIAVDASTPGNLAVYVIGDGYSTWGSPIRGYSGDTDGFVMKLTAASGWALQWNTFLGSGQDDFANALAVDPTSGNVYVAGVTTSNFDDYARRKYSWLSDGFVESFNSIGQSNWVTYLGGNDVDNSESIVFANNNLYVAGISYGPWGSPIAAYTGGADGFVASIDPATGNLLWNTFAGGAGWDSITSLTVSSLGQIYAGGISAATWGGPSSSYTAGYDGMVFVLKPDGSREWNTFLGGSGNDEVYAVTIRGNNYLYVVGSSSASWGFPIINAFHPGSSSGNTDAFVVRIDPNTGLYDQSGWVTFLGGAGNEAAFAVTTNLFAYIYVAGISDTTWGAPRRAYTFGNDAFAAYLSSSGALQWNTFLGGSGDDRAVGITMDSLGNLLVTGTSNANWGTPLISFHGNNDIFVSRLTWNGDLVWNVFQGGSGSDTASGVATFGSIANGTEHIYTVSSTDAPWVANPFSWQKDGNDSVLASLDSRYFFFTPFIRK